MVSLSASTSDIPKIVQPHPICIYTESWSEAHLSRFPYSEDASRPASPAPAGAAAATKQAAPTPAATRGTPKARGGPASRGGKYYQRGGKSAPREKENAEVAEDASGEPRKRGTFLSEPCPAHAKIRLVNLLRHPHSTFAHLLVW